LRSLDIAPLDIESPDVLVTDIRMPGQSGRCATGALPIYGDGLNVGDWLHVSDHCRGIDLALSPGVAGEVYNIGGGAECTNPELVSVSCQIADETFRARSELRGRYPASPAAHGESAASPSTYVRDRPGHDRRYAIDCGKIERHPGYAARMSLGQRLQSTFNWYLQYETWWRDVMNGTYKQWIQTHYCESGHALYVR
jgi:dTDP-glucose 4,6-dehydratase